MRKFNRLHENRIRQIVNETINEFIAGGNDWGNTYSDYQRMNRTNAELDDVVRELHTICQYYEEIFNDAQNGSQSRYFPQCTPEQLKYASKLISKIYALLMNRNNTMGDNHAMTIEDIRNSCFDSLEGLSEIEQLGPICNAARRALRHLQ